MESSLLMRRIQQIYQWPSETWLAFLLFSTLCTVFQSMFVNIRWTSTWKKANRFFCKVSLSVAIQLLDKPGCDSVIWLFPLTTLSASSTSTEVPGVLFCLKIYNMEKAWGFLLELFPQLGFFCFVLFFCQLDMLQFICIFLPLSFMGKTNKQINTKKTTKTKKNPDTN